MSGPGQLLHAPSRSILTSPIRAEACNRSPKCGFGTSDLRFCRVAWHYLLTLPGSRPLPAAPAPEGLPNLPDCQRFRLRPQADFPRLDSPTETAQFQHINAAAGWPPGPQCELCFLAFCLIGRGGLIDQLSTGRVSNIITVG